MHKKGKISVLQGADPIIDDPILYLVIMAERKHRFKWD